MQLKKNWYDTAFVLLLIVFVLLKIQDIATPYFWDELGVYVPGALKMKDDGTIGLLPSCLEPLYSRGHPLLFVFSQALFFKIFGDTVTIGHSFSIILGVLTLVVFYFCSKDLFNRKVAFFSCLLLSVQPVFFAMSGVILPEMMLTLFTIPAVWGIIRQRWGAYIMCGSLAMLTKESAIIIPPIALLFLFIDSLMQKDFFTLRRFKLFIYGLVPLFVYAVFLLIQKMQNGWYFFPEHVGYLRLNESLISYGKYITKDVIFYHGRWPIGAFLTLGVFMNFFRKDKEVIQRTIYVSAVFIAACIVFGDLNFYLRRYMLYALPFVILVATYAATSLAEVVRPQLSNVFFLLFIAVAVYFPVKNMDPKEFNDTADMSYKHVVYCEKDAIAWAEKQPWRDSLIEANFPVFQGISDMRNGYLTEKPFRFSVNYEKKTRYGILFHLNDEPIPVWNGSSFRVIKRFDRHFAHISVVEFD